MSKDFSHPQYPFFENDPGDKEGHLEEGGGITLSNVDGEEHPFFSAKGMLNLINDNRNMANSFAEKPLQGTIKDEVVKGIISASRKTKLPMDLIIFAMDWDRDMTQRKEAGDAEIIAKKILNNIPQLRSSLGRDPQYSEIFAGFVLGAAGKVKELFDNAEKKPDEKVKPLGSQKDNILMMKTRADQAQKRTNAEMYNWFSNRMSNGSSTFTGYVKEESYDKDELQLQEALYKATAAEAYKDEDADQKQLDDALHKATMAAAYDEGPSKK